MYCAATQLLAQERAGGRGAVTDTVHTALFVLQQGPGFELGAPKAWMQLEHAPLLRTRAPVRPRLFQATTLVF